MILTLHLLDELSARMTSVLSEDEHELFAVSAISKALQAYEQGQIDCLNALEEAVKDIESRRTISIEEEERRWADQKSILLAKG